MNQDLFRIKQN